MQVHKMPHIRPRTVSTEKRLVPYWLIQYSARVHKTRIFLNYMQSSQWDSSAWEYLHSAVHWNTITPKNKVAFKLWSNKEECLYTPTVNKVPNWFYYCSDLAQGHKSGQLGWFSPMTICAAKVDWEMCIRSCVNIFLSWHVNLHINYITQSEEVLC